MGSTLYGEHHSAILTGLRQDWTLHYMALKVDVGVQSEFSKSMTHTPYQYWS